MTHGLEIKLANARELLESWKKVLWIEKTEELERIFWMVNAHISVITCSRNLVRKNSIRKSSDRTLLILADNVLSDLLIFQSKIKNLLNQK